MVHVLPPEFSVVIWTYTGVPFAGVQVKLPALWQLRLEAFVKEEPTVVHDPASPVELRWTVIVWTPTGELPLLRTHL